MCKYFVLLLSSLFVANAESMEQFIDARDDFIEGSYSDCLKKMSDIAVGSLPSKQMAVGFLSMLFPTIKKEADASKIAYTNPVITVGFQPTVEERKSLSLAALARGKKLLDDGKREQANIWLSTSLELDGDSTDASCYLQDISVEGSVVPPTVYPIFEDLDLGE